MTTTGAVHARARARAVLRVRAAAIACAAAAVVLLAGGAVRTAAHGTTGVALAVVAGLLSVLVLWLVVALAAVRTPASPAVVLPPDAAPDFHALVEELAQRLEVPAPQEIHIAPECDSWLEADRLRGRGCTVLVVGAPFVWWLRVGELRALLAPVVAGTEPAADRTVATARRWVRRLDTCADPTRPRAGLSRMPQAVARQLLDIARPSAELMEHDIAVWAAHRAQSLDAPLRAAAHEQVGLAYAGWDRLLTRLAEPAWQLGRCPDALMSGVVAALTDLAGRDRLAEGFSARLAQTPACDLLERPDHMDAQVSALAARVFSRRTDLLPVAWERYPAEVVEPVWRQRAAVLVRALDTSDGRPGPATVNRVLDRLRRGPVAGDALPDGADGPVGLVGHVTALVACAAVDAGAIRPVVDWLDGPVLLDGHGNRADVTALVSRAVDDHDDAPLRSWLEASGVPALEPVHLRG